MKAQNNSTKRVILTIFLSYLWLILSQVVALLIGQLLTQIGSPNVIGSLISGILYVTFTLFGVSLFCKKILNTSIKQYKMSKFTLSPIWCISAFVLPLMVSGVLLLTNGYWDNPQMNVAKALYVIIDAVVFYGFAAGVVEEIVFRGIIMNELEKRWNRWVAILVPSIVFALSHIIGTDLDFISIIQLLIAGSLVGILFSLVVYQSNNIWNSIFMHSIWNIIIIGGILHISDKADNMYLYNYVLKSESFLITGGDFGIEASVFAIIGYSIFIGLALLLKPKKS